MAIGKSILHSPTKYCHLKLFIKILFKKYQLVVLCLIYHRNFDSVVAIYDSNWYIKRLNNIEIDKKKKSVIFESLVTIFSRGSKPPSNMASISCPIPLSPLFKTPSYSPD